LEQHICKGQLNNKYGDCLSPHPTSHNIHEQLTTLRKSTDDSTKSQTPNETRA